MGCARILPVGVALALLSGASAAPAPKKPKGHATPEACFKAARASWKKGDFKAYGTCLTEEAQERLAGRLLLDASGLSTRKPSAGAVNDGPELNKVLVKHRLTGEKMERVHLSVRRCLGARIAWKKIEKGLAVYIEDKLGFVADMLAVRRKALGAGEGLMAGDLRDVKVKGGRAEATIVSKQGNFRVVFARGKGGWKMGLIVAE